MVRLEDLIGKKVLFVPKVPFREGEKSGTSYTVTLHGVEMGGVWIQSKALTRLVGDLAPKQKSPVFFVPYGEIQFLIAYSLNLDEQSLQA